MGKHRKSGGMVNARHESNLKYHLGDARFASKIDQKELSIDEG
jgi:hypothetical protein